MTVGTVCSQPHRATVDVTGRLPIEGAHHVAAWVFAPPADTAGAVPVLFCLPGGTYSKAYWHLEVPGRCGYSFAEYMADRGMLVIAVDHINTGDSSRHRHARELLPHVVADANAIAYTQLVARAQTGELGPGIPPLTLGPQIGVGHSMGAMLAVIQQSRHQSFDAVAALGYGTVGPIVSMHGADDTYRATAEEIFQLADTGALDELQVDRTDPQLRHHFYDNVPDEVIAADDLTVTSLPGVTGLLSIVPFIVSDHVSRLRCPVFIGLGERDSTPAHHDEAKAYGSSHDITLFILEGSAHCHNTANTRHRLWARLAGWVQALEAGN